MIGGAKSFIFLRVVLPGLLLSDTDLGASGLTVR